MKTKKLCFIMYLMMSPRSLLIVVFVFSFLVFFSLEWSHFFQEVFFLLSFGLLLSCERTACD